MSRIAKVPVPLLAGVAVTLNNQQITVTGKLGTLMRTLHPTVVIEQNDSSLHFSLPDNAESSVKSQAGTARSLVNAMVIGVTDGFSKKLQLVGVGYRAQIKERAVHLSLGFSHPIEHQLPQGITVECATPTEMLVKGIDKQLVGQVAADLRAYRPPEPYKGKGVRYADETVRLKEAKKK